MWQRHLIPGFAVHLMWTYLNPALWRYAMLSACRHGIRYSHALAAALCPAYRLQTLTLLRSLYSTFVRDELQAVFFCSQMGRLPFQRTSFYLPASRRPYFEAQPSAQSHGSVPTHRLRVQVSVDAFSSRVLSPGLCPLIKPTLYSLCQFFGFDVFTGFFE